MQLSYFHLDFEIIRMNCKLIFWTETILSIHLQADIITISTLYDRNIHNDRMNKLFTSEESFLKKIDSSNFLTSSYRPDLSLCNFSLILKLKSP